MNNLKYVDSGNDSISHMLCVTCYAKIAPPSAVFEGLTFTSSLNGCARYFLQFKNVLINIIM